MNRKWIAIAVLLVLMLSVCLFAAAEEATDPVYPGQNEPHVHDVQIKIVDRGYTAHRLHEWCPSCRRLLNERLEGHSFENGVCTVCDWECPHPPEAAVKHTERDGVKPQWDGNYIICPGWEVTECSICGMELSRVETTVREFHNLHTHFTPVLGCVPHDSSKHALIRFCDECGTEVPEYAAHNCPPSDVPYTDDGDIDTHVRYVKCDDCGDMVPQRQAHAWVHDKYTEFDGMGDYHNEVMRCSVCGAIKQVPQKHEWKLISCVADDGGKTHISTYECKACGDWKEATAPHTFEHYAYKNDGNTESHIDVLACTECGQIVEGERVVHKPTHIGWENISDTQDREILRCNQCELTYTGAPVAHTFNTEVYVSNGCDYGNIGKTTHSVYMACGKCGQRKSTPVRTEKHTYADHARPLTCTKCNEGGFGKHVIDENSTLAKWISISASKHVGIYICNYCNEGLVQGKNPTDHTFDPVTMKCTLCGYLKEGCEHHYTYKTVKNGITAEKHTVIGTCTACGKQITVTDTHDMQFVSATDYKSDENGHTHDVTYRCSWCGYETTAKETEVHKMKLARERFEPCEDGHLHIMDCHCTVCGFDSVKKVTEGHTATRGTEEPFDDENHKVKCGACGAAFTEAHWFSVSSSDETHQCRYCGYEKEHTYWLIKASPIDIKYHTAHCKCVYCYHEAVIENEPHIPTVQYILTNQTEHLVRYTCKECKIPYYNVVEDHEFDSQDICTKCDYHRGDPVPEAPQPEADFMENGGDATAVTPVFCHLTADGEEILFEYAFELTEDGDAIDLMILPETASGDAVIEIRFNVSELEPLQVLGIKNIYLRLNENDILLLDDIAQALTVLSEQETDELLITLTPVSEEDYIMEYEPNGVYTVS